MTEKLLVIYKYEKEKEYFSKYYLQPILFISKNEIALVLEKEYLNTILNVFVSYYLLTEIYSFLNKMKCSQCFLFFLSKKGKLTYYNLGIPNRSKNTRSRILSVYSHRNVYHIKINNIIYISSENLKVIIHTHDMDITIYEKLSEIEKKISSNQFLRVHQSFLINKEYVTIVKRYQIQLIAGIIIPVSKRYSKEVKQSLQHI